MNTVLLRGRYLAALGLSSSVVVACSSNEAPVTPETPATAAATEAATETTPVEVPPVATSAPTASVSATTAPSAAPKVAYWQPTVSKKPAHVGPPTPGPMEHMPTCPSGAFCVAETDAKGSPSAAAPLDRCAMSISDPEVPPSGGEIHFDVEQTKRERTAKKDACCYSWFIPCPGGRPLRIGGGARLAEETASNEWLGSRNEPRLTFADLGDAERQALADHCAREASYEHASVAAFARVSLALLALGAPPHLLADTHRAALDEIRHAEEMFALASRLRAAPVGPGTLDIGDAAMPTVSFEALASEAFFEGCVGEVAAALVLREEARRALTDELRTTLESMADDEERHAELAWKTVAWALSRAPEEVMPALLTARASVAAELDPPAVSAIDSRPLPGLTSDRERRALRLRALREVVLPCLDALVGTPARASANTPS